MKIAVDAFGGDNAPDEVIKGAAEAVEMYGVDIILTGDENIIRDRIKALGVSEKGLSIVPADGVIQIEDNPLDIRKAKKDCSMGKAFQLVVNGEADAFRQPAKESDLAARDPGFYGSRGTVRGKQS